MTIQQIIERLLRARLYRTLVSVETDSGETREGLVQEIRYDGSRSFVLVGPAHRGSPGRRIPLARIVSVGIPGEVPAPAGSSSATSPSPGAC